MHEAALYRELRRGVVDAARAEHATRVARVDVWIGALCHVRAPQLAADWPEIVAGTVAEGSTLTVEASTDVRDPRADGILLRSITVAGPDPSPGPRISPVADR